jgi:hypothetical protein
MKTVKHMVLYGAVALAGCSTVPGQSDSSAPLLSGETTLCETAEVAIRSGYTASRANDCETLSELRFVIDIRPEAFVDPEGKTINNSPWYGFRVAPKTAGTVRVRLDYEGGSHRYDPKVSRDGRTWTRLSQDRIIEISDESVELKLNPGSNPLFVSAQEIFAPAAHRAWTQKIGERNEAVVSEIGKSARGTPLLQIDIQTEPDIDKPYVVLIGRQHPPEVTGAYALIPYVETILNGSDLSQQFLKDFNLLVIPMVNPDGVEDGNWRFNTGGMDLNRDWGPFSQPETQAVRAALERFHAGEDDIIFFLDFHSTSRNLLYTQADDEPTNPAMFTRDWLAAVETRIDDADYPFTREARHNSGRPISKNYMYESFGIPSITYEVGDETPRPAISQASAMFSEEMMRLLLTHADTP